MKKKILTFFLKRKNKGYIYTGLIVLDRYLVNVEKETSFLGNELLILIQSMLENELLVENKDKKYSITSKGLAYLEQNSEE